MQNEDAPPTSNPEQTLPEKNEILLVENPKEKQINSKKRMKKKTEEDIQEEEEEKGEKYPISLFGEFEFDLYDGSLKPDCTFILDDRINYVYFNLKSLYNTLEQSIAELFKKYPKNLENLKEPLEKYLKEYQKEEFKEQT